MTLKELLKDQKLPCKIIFQKWPKTDYVEILAVNEKYAIGFGDDGTAQSYFMHDEGFSLYTEPKRLVKKKMYHAVMEGINGYNFINTDLFYEREDALNFRWKFCSKPIGVQEIEVEVYE